MFNLSIVIFGNSGEKSPEFPKSGIRVPGTRMPLNCMLCMNTRLMIGNIWELVRLVWKTRWIDWWMRWLLRSPSKRLGHSGCIFVDPQVKAKGHLSYCFSVDPRVNGEMPLELYFLCRPSSKRWDAPRVIPIGLGTGLRVNGEMPLGETCH